MSKLPHKITMSLENSIEKLININNINKRKKKRKKYMGNK